MVFLICISVYPLAPACVIAILVVLMMERKTLRQAAQVLRSQATAPASVESRETV